MENIARFCAVFEEDMKTTVRSKHRGMLTNEDAVLRDNTRPHTTASTVEMIRKLKFEPPHRAYSPDLSPFSYQFSDR